MKFKKFVGAFENASKELRSIRGHIEALKVEIRAVEQAVLPREEAVANIDRALDHLASRVSFDVLSFASPYYDGPRQDLEAVIRHRYLAAVARARMVDELDRELEKRPPGLPKEGRAGRLLELKNELLDAEREEEAFIEAANAAGMKTPRRPDADPRAVLDIP